MLYLIFFVLLLATAMMAYGADECTEDVWDCTAWSECSIDGVQTRTCTLVSICPNADNDKPLEAVECVYVSDLSRLLDCSEIETSKERIRCILNSQSYPPSDLNIGYLPEECSNAIGGEDKDACIRRYSDAAVCWSDNYHDTDDCLKTLLNLDNGVLSRKNACNNDASCIEKLDEDVLSLAKFRIHELEYRVEGMLDKNLISENSAVEIIYYLEHQKLALDNAPSRVDRIKALSNVKDNWDDFVDDLELGDLR
ncbi:MAG: hypothetical protein ACP5NV_06350 [Candidatus Woesearchaeota archaeon]